MELQFTKIPDRCMLTCLRDDGTYTQADLGPDFPMHDFAHFIVEKKFKLTDGFYGHIASGSSIQELSDKELLKTMSPEIWLSEIMSRNLQSMGSGACTAVEYIELVAWEAQLIQNIQVPELTVSLVDEMNHHFDTLCAKWDLLSYGEKLILRY